MEVTVASSRAGDSGKHSSDEAYAVERKLPPTLAYATQSKIEVRTGKASPDHVASIPGHDSATAHLVAHRKATGVEHLARKNWQERWPNLPGGSGHRKSR